MNSVIERLRSRKIARLSSMLLAGGSLVTVAQGQTWSGTTDGSFSDGTNWVGGVPPVNGNTLVFDTSANTTLTQNIATLTSLGGLTFNSGASAFTINSSTAITVAGNITHSAANTQTWNGAVTWTGAARTLAVSDAAGVLAFGSTGTTYAHVITGGTGTNKATLTGLGEVRYLSNTSGSLAMANTVNGDIDMSGLAKLTVNTGTISIASGGTGGVASTGTITLAADTTLTANTFKLGDTLGGTLVNNPQLKLGTTTTINATTINIGSTRSSGTLSFNATSGSTLTIRGTAGGTTKADITLGYYQTSPGAYNPAATMNFTGGSVDARISNLILGRQAPAGAVTANSNTAQGTFTMPAGTVIADTVRLGYWSGGNTTGTGTNQTALGTLNVSGGTFTVNTALRAGDGTAGGTNSIARGVINVSGTGVLDVSGAFLLGIDAAGGAASNQRGTLNITGGTVNANVSILSSGGQSTLTLNGGTLDMKGNSIGSATAAEQIGLNGGSLNFRSGTLQNLNGINGSEGLTKTTTGTLTLLGTMVYSGTTTISAGTLQLGNGGTTGSLGNTLAVVNDGTLRINRSDAVAITNDISGSGGLEVAGAGTVTMSGNLSYAGNTSVTGAGGLIVNGTVSGSAVTVDTFLGGNSSYGAAVTVSATGTIAAGNSIGTMNFANGLTMNGAMDVELDGNTNLADLYNVTGLLSIGNGATLNFTQLNPVTGSAYVFAKYTTWNGQQFTTINGTPNGWTVNYNYNDGTSTNNFALVAVPEPGAVALSMLGGLLLFGRRKRS